MSMEIADVSKAIEGQARHIEDLGCVGTARVVRAFAALVDGDTQCGARMRDWPAPLLEDAVPLRLAGGLHYLHLTGEDSRLLPLYSGRVSDQAEADAIVHTVVSDHDAFLLDWFSVPPQTNEAGRSACIMACLLWLSERIGSRFELNEIGASAGINTMMDRFSFDLGGVRVGKTGSSIDIEPDWRGPPPPEGNVEIVASRGCDATPIDLLDAEQALRLKSYCWPDAPQRGQRIDAAIVMASERAPELDSADAGDWVSQRLVEPQASGVTRVIWHSIVWQYLPAETRARLEREIEQAGARATIEQPLAWVRFETNRETFRHEIDVRYWPGGDGGTLLGHAHAHGTWIAWFGD